MDLGTVATIIGQIGALGVSVLVLVALVREWLVPRGRLDDMRRDRDKLAKQVEDLVDLERLAGIFRK